MPRLSASPIDAIPDPLTVRLALAQLVREQALLRGLLRLAQRKEEAMRRDAAQAQECRTRIV